jgi:hypothetical protein
MYNSIGHDEYTCIFILYAYLHYLNIMKYLYIFIYIYLYNTIGNDEKEHKKKKKKNLTP